MRLNNVSYSNTITTCKNNTKLLVKNNLSKIFSIIQKILFKLMFDSWNIWKKEIFMSPELYYIFLTFALFYFNSIMIWISNYYKLKKYNYFFVAFPYLKWKWINVNIIQLEIFYILAVFQFKILKYNIKTIMVTACDIFFVLLI